MHLLALNGTDKFVIACGFRCGELLAQGGGGLNWRGDLTELVGLCLCLCDDRRCGMCRLWLHIPELVLRIDRDCLNGDLTVVVLCDRFAVTDFDVETDGLELPARSTLFSARVFSNCARRPLPVSFSGSVGVSVNVVSSLILSSYGTPRVCKRRMTVGTIPAG